MAKFKKSVLHAGQTYKSPDGEVAVTADRLKHWAGGFKKLTAAKYRVPADWDHADSLDKLQPVKLSDQKKRRSAKNTVGHLHDFKLAKDGQSAELIVEVTDPVAIGRADRNEVYVSPVILDRWRDGHGTEYSDVITHVDFVNHPVDHSQGPFKRLPEVEAGSVALALRMGLSQPYVRMADDDGNPFAKKDGDGDGTAGEGDGDGKPEEPENPDLPEAEGDSAEAEAIVAHLSQLGVELPADWSFKADAAGQILLAALKTANRAKLDSQAEEEAAEEEPKEETTVADPGFAAMSLYAENMHRDQLQAKLDALLESGRCTPAEAKAQEAALSAIKLSLDASGKQLDKSDLEKFIEHREAVPKGTFWDDKVRTTKMSAEVLEPPAHQRGDMTRDEVQNTVNFALGRKPAANK